MKVILSRKGIDSSSGGTPSPILPDGTLLSLPIPAKNDELAYTNLYYNGVSYSDILAQLKPQDQKIGKWNCHLDPDIRANTRKNTIHNWIPSFGQCDAAQSYLANQEVGEGDLFLFFGWFKQTEGNLYNGTLRYVPDAPDLHVLYAYLQVGKVVIDREEIAKDYTWHPHSSSHFLNKHSNAIYTSAYNLDFSPFRRGSDAFTFSEKYVLTLPSHTRATWKEVPALFPENISKNVKNSAKETGIYYAGQWQELVLKDSEATNEWVKSLF